MRINFTIVPPRIAAIEVLINDIKQNADDELRPDRNYAILSEKQMISTILKDSLNAM